MAQAKLNEIPEKDEIEFDEFVDNEQENGAGDKLIETSFILPIDSLKDFPPLPLLDQSLKESYTTANNGNEDLEQQAFLLPKV